MVDLAIRDLKQRRYDSRSATITLSRLPSLILVASGEGSRRVHFLSMLRKEAEGVRTIAIFTSTSQAVREPFKRKDVEQLSCTEACAAVVDSRRDEDGVACIFIDVSCLPRQQIGAVFAALKHLASTGPVELQMAYSLARFVKPPQHWSSAIRSFAPVNDEFAGWTATPEKPIELVIGIGYERGKAMGATEFLEPRDTWLFVPDSVEQEYFKEVRAQNYELLHERENNLLSYDVLQPVDAFHTLLSLVRGMKQVARPILLPFGPKVFFGVSLLVAMLLEEAAVWFVDGEDTSGTDSGQPSPHSVVLDCRIEPRDPPTGQVLTV
jgi:hypothetical protein